VHAFLVEIRDKSNHTLKDVLRQSNSIGCRHWRRGAQEW
jgi:hypothetical protein